MAVGDKRRRRIARFDSRELARLSGKVNPSAAAWDERVPLAQASDRLPVARTATVDDPLTTSLLAEVTRRTSTVEVSPDQIDEVTSLEPAAGEPSDGDPETAPSETAPSKPDPAR
jgi:hypothetical protein